MMRCCALRRRKNDRSGYACLWLVYQSQKSLKICSAWQQSLFCPWRSLGIRRIIPTTTIFNVARSDRLTQAKNHYSSHFQSHPSWAIPSKLSVGLVNPIEKETTLPKHDNRNISLCLQKRCCIEQYRCWASGETMFPPGSGNIYRCYQSDKRCDESWELLAYFFRFFGQWYGWQSE